MTEAELREHLSRMIELVASLSRQLTVEQSVVDMLVAVAAANKWPVDDALYGMLRLATEARVSTEVAEQQRLAYVERLETLLGSDFKEPTRVSVN